MAGRTAPRIRMQIVAAGEDVPVADAPAADAPPAESESVPPVAAGDRFHTLVIVEDTWTGDDRQFVANSLTWRDLPLPLMALDTTTWEHQDAVLIGNIDTIERRGVEIHGWGSYLSNPGEDAARLIDLVQRGELRGVSADIDAVEFEVLFPVEPEAEAAALDDGVVDDSESAGMPTETDPETGVEYVVMSLPSPRMRVTDGRIMGATVCPFPAFQEAFIEPEMSEPAALAASGYAALNGRVTGMVLAPLVASAAGTLEARPHFQFPDIPPGEWFTVPEPPGSMPLTILDSGQVFGHLATWGTCHIGLAGECVEAPSSPSNYARFHVGECPTADGGRVSVGRLTFSTGHADTHLGPDATRAHYDNTGTVAADIVAVDGEYGIWVCGAMRSTLSAAQVREVMASPPSGDWRRFGQHLDLVGALSVNVPGFNVPRNELAASAWDRPVSAGWARARREDGLVTTLIVSRPAEPATAPHVLVASASNDELARRVIDRIAASVGRSRKDRIAELSARVHGKD